MERQNHWEAVYQTKDHTKVGWYQPSCDSSLELLEKLGVTKEASVIDVGAGASTFVDGLLERGFINITLLDVSKEAFEIVKERLGEKGKIPHYLVEDITTVSLPHCYDLWHDRAAFHFLQDESEQEAYVQSMCKALNKEGYAIIGTFSIEGPDSCSALPVKQYNRERMEHLLANRMKIVEAVENVHVTPSGSEQKFTFFTLKPI